MLQLVSKYPTQHFPIKVLINYFIGTEIDLKDFAEQRLDFKVSVKLNINATNIDHAASIHCYLFA